MNNIPQADAFLHLKKQIASLEMFNVLDEDEAYLAEVAQKFSVCEKVLVLGTGGSSLGGKCLVNFQAALDGKSPKVLFLENVDSRSFLNVISSCDPKTTGIIVISKSGRTSETLMVFLTICQLWPDFDFEKNSIAITELSENNDLLELAKSRGMQIIEHNKNIGGRFSVFSNVGLIPAAIAGVDTSLFKKGARSIISDITGHDSFEDSSTFAGLIRTYRAFEKGIFEHVLFSYSDMFDDFGKWYAQIIGESLGKKDTFGITPLRATGTVDQHSLLQLFLGGPSNKFFSMIVQKYNTPTPAVFDNTTNTPVINRLNGHTMQELMFAHQRATIDVLQEKAPIRVLEFNSFSIESLGFLMMLTFAEVIIFAYLAKIDPFDQPAVEKSKKLAMEYLEEE